MGRKAAIIELSAGQEEELKRRIRRPTGEQRVAERARIILAAGTGKTNKELARQLGLNRDTVSLWRQRWAQARERLARAEERSLAALSRYIGDLLVDAPRSGRRGDFSAEQIIQIIAIACEDPQAPSDRPVSHWTPREVAAEAVKRKIVPRISVRTVGRFLKSGRS
jgi:putative transposase